MRRSRAIALIGLVFGFTGCAETHQCVINRPAMGPELSPNALWSNSCQSCTTQPAAPVTAIEASAATPAPTAAPAPTVAPTAAPAPTAVATAESKPRVPSWTTTPEPDPTQPVPVPAPAPAPAPTAEPTRRLSPRHPAMAPPTTRVVRYFPLLDAPRGEPESFWEFSPPDPFGVRAAIARDEQLSRASDRQAASGSDGAIPLSYSVEIPAERRKSVLSRMFSGWSYRGSASTARKTGTESRPKRESGVIPASVLVTKSFASDKSEPIGPMLEVGTPSGPKYGVLKPSETRGKTLDLEVANADASDPILIGTSTTLSQRTNKGSTTAGATKEGASFGFFSFAKPEPKTTDTHRESAVGRFVRRVQGATQAFLDPDSVRRKANDLAERGEGIQRVSAERIDEPTKR